MNMLQLQYNNKGYDNRVEQSSEWKSRSFFMES